MVFLFRHITRDEDVSHRVHEELQGINTQDTNSLKSFEFPTRIVYEAIQAEEYYSGISRKNREIDGLRIQQMRKEKKTFAYYCCF